MRIRLMLLAAVLVVFLTACGGPAGESVPPVESAPLAETDTPAPSVSSEQLTPSAPEPASSVPPAAEGFDSVYTDWSRLEPYQPDLGLYTRYYEEFTDRLIAVEGGYGGPLIPFPGASVGNGMDGGGKYLFGLVTADGTVVCDPVYEGISYSSSYNQELEQYVENNDFLILCRTIFEGEYDPVNYWMGEYVYTVAAGDGSWVLEEGYRHYFALSDGRLLLIDREEGLWLCGQDGTLTRSPLPEKPSVLWGEWWSEMGGFADGVACINTFDPNTREDTGYCLANAVTGEIIPLPDISTCYGWYYSPSLWAEAQDRETNLWGYLDRNGGWAIAPQFSRTNQFEESFACVTLVSGEQAVIDQSGNVMLEVQGDAIRPFRGGYGSNCYLVLEERDRKYVVTGVYDQNFRSVPDHPIVGRVLKNQFSSGAPATQEGNVWTLWDQEGAVCTVETDAELCGTEENGLLLFRDGNGGEGLYDPEAETWVIPMEKGYYYIRFLYELEEAVYGAWDGANEYDLLDADGELIAHVDDVFGIGNGLIRVRDGEYGGFLDTEGNWVFRWPIRENTD